MTESFTRWKGRATGAPSGASELLAQGAPTPDMPEAAQREMDAFITGLAATPAGPAAPWWSTGIAPKLMIGALAITAGALLVSRTRLTTQRSQPTQTAVTIAGTPAPRAPALIQTPSAQTPPRFEQPAATPPAVIESPSEAPAVTAPVPTRRASPEVVAVTPDQLAAEVAMLDRARRALERSPRSALIELETHANTFPRGALAAEREFLAIDATLRAGDHEAAQRRGALFLQRYRSSPYVRRVRALLDALH